MWRNFTEGMSSSTQNCNSYYFRAVSLGNEKWKEKKIERGRKKSATVEGWGEMGEGARSP